ncbi:MAG: hypothetical protein NTV80_17400 [Verrucomicrobia bacterium]|nr:hypothetical protein [Verrucomicrobiota bacterium]
MWHELITLWQTVRDPEYAHLLMESLPLYGLAFGVTLLVVAFVVNERKCRLLALGLIFISCASVWPYLDFRLKATPRILATRAVEYGPIIKEQTQLRQDTAWAFYLMAVVTLIAMGMTRSRHSRWGILAVLVGSVALFWLSVWLHKKECEVYHPNIKRHSIAR